MIESVLIGLFLAAGLEALKEYDNSKSYKSAIREFVFVPLRVLIVPPIFAYIFTENFFRKITRKP